MGRSSHFLAEKLLAATVLPSRLVVRKDYSLRARPGYLSRMDWTTLFAQNDKFH